MRRLESNAKGDFPQGTEWAFPTGKMIRAKSATLSIDGKTLFFGSWDTYVCEFTMQRRIALSLDPPTTTLKDLLTLPRHTLCSSGLPSPHALPQTRSTR